MLFEKNYELFPVKIKKSAMEQCQSSKKSKHQFRMPIYKSVD